MDAYYSAEQALQKELLSGETLLWAGQPCRRVVFRKEDLYLVPFSLMWGGFAIFWEAMATGWVGNNSSQGHANWFFMLWGVPFVIVGQYMIWGRFIYNWWKKARMFYGVTASRVIVLDLAWGHKVNAAYIDQIPVINKSVRKDGIGTVVFGIPPAQKGRRNNADFDSLPSDGVPTFADIENAEAIYGIVSDQRDKLTSAPRPFSS
jgi:hypothetical protein